MSHYMEIWLHPFSWIHILFAWFRYFLNNAENRSTYIKMDTGVVYFMVRSETIGLARASRLSVCMITDYGFERVEYEYFDAHYHIEYAFKFKIIRIDLAAGVSNPSLYLTLNVGLYSTTMLKWFKKKNNWLAVNYIDEVRIIQDNVTTTTDLNTIHTKLAEWKQCLNRQV